MPTLTTNGIGQIDLSTSFFDNWIIDEICSTLMDQLHDKSGSALLHHFTAGAAVLAREVRAAGYDWRHASNVYSWAAERAGLAQATIAGVLDQAWHWSDAGLGHWCDLAKAWVLDWQFDEFVHIRSGDRLTMAEFHALFQMLSPHDEHAITRFLIDGDWIVSVDRVHRDGARTEFRGPGHALELTLPY